MLLKSIPLESQNHIKNISHDGMDIFTLEGDTVRGALINATLLVNQARTNHDLGILESMALGYGYMAGLLSSQQLKGEDRLRLDLGTDGAFSGFSIEASATGDVRGYLKNNTISLTEAPKSLNLSPYIGNGTLTLTRMLEGSKEPVSGAVELQFHDIALDLAWFFHQSEQTKTAFALGVSFNEKGAIDGAGGLFIQALPNAHEVVLDDLSDWLPQLPSLAKALAKGDTGAHYIHEHFKAFDPKIMGVRPVQFNCRCSWQSFQKYLLSLNIKERVDLIESGPMPLEVMCHNCATNYTYQKEDIGL